MEGIWEVLECEIGPGYLGISYTDRARMSGLFSCISCRGSDRISDLFFYTEIW